MCKVGMKVILLAMASVFVLGISGCASFQAPPGVVVNTHTPKAAYAQHITDTTVQHDKGLRCLPKEQAIQTSIQAQLYESMGSLVGSTFISKPPMILGNGRSRILTEADDPKVKV